MVAKPLYIIALGLNVILIATVNSQDQGLCTFRSGGKGICTPIKECASALNLLKKGVQAEVCGFEKNQSPIVCCELPAGEKSKKYCRDLVDVLVKENAFTATGVGGVDSLAKEFPHMAALGYQGKNETVWGCGGTLISSKFVLTAAHCLRNTEMGKLIKVRLGDLNLKSDADDAQPQEFRVLKVHRHPNYVLPSRYNDIALVELDGVALRSPYVQVACLNPIKFIDPKQEVIATGWGRLGFARELANHLQKLIISLVENKQCKKFYSTNRRLSRGILDDLQICAGHPERDTCEGDSGGPLQRKFPIPKKPSISVYMIYGITSFGKACGLSPAPGVYTRVSNYLGWIESIVWPN